MKGKRIPISTERGKNLRLRAKADPMVTMVGVSELRLLK